MNPPPVDHWLQLFNKVRELFAYHVPTDNVPDSAVVGMALVAAGLLVGIFGAQYARGILCGMLGGIGFLIGDACAPMLNAPTIVGGLIGFVILAVIGYYTYRLWVGVTVALVLSGLALTFYGGNIILPEYSDFVASRTDAPDPQGSFTIPKLGQDQAEGGPRPWNHVKEFYTRFNDSQPATSRRSIGIVVLCLVCGFAFGAVWTRWSLILACAAIATMIFNSGVLTFCERYGSEGWEQKLVAHPYGVMGFVFGCYALSCIAQLRITQPGGAVAPKKKDRED